MCGLSRATENPLATWCQSKKQLAESPAEGKGSTELADQHETKPVKKCVSVDYILHTDLQKIDWIATTRTGPEIHRRLTSYKLKACRIQNTNNHGT